MKTPSDAEQVIASRLFDRADGVVRLSIHKPAPVPDPRYDADPDNPPWRCLYTIEFPDGTSKRHAPIGIDAVQAVLLAFASAEHSLRYVGDGTPTRRPPLEWLGTDDLGLSTQRIGPE